TAFMSVLMGKVRRTSGELRINGTPAEMDKFSKIIGYVPQDDIMLREMTVREIVLYSARVRLPRTWTAVEVEAHVDNILDALNLTPVAHTQIGDELTRGVSGGQRKRVNIAMELAALPVALFLDEPTSGLDATAALDVASMLRAVARLRLTTVVAVVHQPRVEVFTRFDDVLLVAPGGRTAYLGPVPLARTYFESMGFAFEDAANPADVLMDILAGRGVPSTAGAAATKLPGPDDLPRRWLADGPAFLAAHGAGPALGLHPSAGSSASVPSTATATASATAAPAAAAASLSTDARAAADLASMRTLAATRGAGFLRQATLAHARSLTQQRRFLGSLWMEVFVGLLAGLILGVAALTEESYRGFLVGNFVLLSAAPDEWFVGLYGMIIGIAIAVASAPSAVRVFGEEKAVYFREAAAGHNKLAYYL
ncbi:hypothetical protein HK405_014329, partial [Cladochytrium tenue]